MKATICHFCGEVTPDSDNQEMRYDVIVNASDGFEAQSEFEKSVLYDGDDVCATCVRYVHAFLVELETIRHAPKSPFTAQQDDELVDWLVNASQKAGDFVKQLAEAGLRADHDNYPILRPALLQLKAKYPKYGKAEGRS